MAPPRKADHQAILKDLRAGLSYKQVAEKHNVNTTYVGVVRSRAEETNRVRYTDLIPEEWHGHRRLHGQLYHIQRLQFLGKLRRTGKLAEAEQRKLDIWLAEMKARDAVVWYSPEVGAIAVPRGDGDNEFTSIASAEEIAARQAARPGVDFEES